MQKIIQRILGLVQEYISFCEQPLNLVETKEDFFLQVKDKLFLAFKALFDQVRSMDTRGNIPLEQIKGQFLTSFNFNHFFSE